MSRERVSVVMPARNETESFKNGFIDKVFASIPEEYDPHVTVVVNNSTPEFVDLAEELGRNKPNLRVVQLGKLEDKTFAYAYLHGLRQDVDDGMEYLVEMDATGAHDPRYISDFVRPLQQGRRAALSSRFSRGGGIERYPLQRKAISYGGTILSNLVLGLRSYVPDMTSGYEAFRRETLNDVFGVVRPEDWVSVVRGPGHFYQVEMRAYVLWDNDDVAIVPMVWGTDRAKEPNLLPTQTALQAMWNLVLIRERKKLFDQR